MKIAPRWLARIAPVLFVAGVAIAAPDDTGVSTTTSKQVNLTAQEMVTKVKEFRNLQQDSLKLVTKLADDAQKKKDVIRLNCVNDKLVQIKGNMAVTDKSYGTLLEAVSKGDNASQVHEYARLAILAEKVQVLRTEAQQCVGEDVTYFGDQRVIVEIDPSIPGNDPTEYPPPPLEPIPRPTEASPET